MHLCTQSLPSAQHANLGHGAETVIDARLMHQEGYHCKAMQVWQDMTQNSNVDVSLSPQHQPVFSHLSVGSSLLGATHGSLPPALTSPELCVFSASQPHVQHPCPCYLPTSHTASLPGLPNLEKSSILVLPHQ